MFTTISEDEVDTTILVQLANRKSLISVRAWWSSALSLATSARSAPTSKASCIGSVLHATLCAAGAAAPPAPPALPAGLRLLLSSSSLCVSSRSSSGAASQDTSPWTPRRWCAGAATCAPGLSAQSSNGWVQTKKRQTVNQIVQLYFDNLLAFQNKMKLLFD